jgi:SnoaL-like protein
MPERTGREWAQGFQDLMSARDFARLPEFIHRDCVHDYPQSGERISGIDHIRAVFENYPGGLGRTDIDSLDVAGDDRRWAMAPNFQLISVTGGGSSYSSVVRARYPDDSVWYVVTMFELVDGKQSRASLYFAPEFEAPDWRRPYVDAGSTAKA